MSGNNIYVSTFAGGASLAVSSNGGSSFTTYSTTNGLGSNTGRGVFVSGGSVYAATDGGLSIAQLPAPPASPAPAPLPLFGAASAFGFSRKLRRRLRAAASTSC